MSQQITLHAKDISCPHCAATIRRELESVEGVSVVDVSVSDKTVTLEYQDDAALARAEAILDEIGYPVERVV